MSKRSNSAIQTKRAGKFATLTISNRVGAEDSPTPNGSMRENSRLLLPNQIRRRVLTRGHSGLAINKLSLEERRSARRTKREHFHKVLTT